jgi:hypothetical protein
LPKHNTFFVRRILLSREAIERDREKDFHGNYQF